MGDPAHHLRSRYNMEKRIRVDKMPGKSIVNLEEKLLNYDLLRDHRCDPAALICCVIIGVTPQPSNQ